MMMRMRYLKYTMYNSEKDKKLMQNTFFYGSFFEAADFDGVPINPTKHLPANCFFNNNDDCVSDI